MKTTSALFAISLCAAVLAFISAPHSTQAHGAGTINFLATTTEGYVIDVDWEALTIEAGVSGTWAFRLYRDTTWTEEIPYKDLWVRIILEDGSEQGNTIFAGPIAHPEFGYPRFLYVFPEGGKYTLAVRYNRYDENTLNAAKEIYAEFPFSVGRSREEGQFQFNEVFFVGVAGGAIAALLFSFSFIFLSHRKGF